MGQLWWATVSIAAGLCDQVTLEGRSCFDGDRVVSGALPWCYDARVDALTNETFVSCAYGIAYPTTAGVWEAPAVCGEDGVWRTDVVCEAAPQMAWRLRNTGSLRSGWWVHRLEFGPASCRDPPPPAAVFASSAPASFPVEQAFDESRESAWHAECSGECPGSFIGIRLNDRLNVQCVALRQFYSESYRADNISLEMWEG